MSDSLRPLIEAAKAGDRKAASELAGCVDRFVRMFSGSLSQHLRRTQGSTLDFVLEGVAEALTRLDTYEYRSDGQFYAWVASIIRSRLIDTARHESRKKRGVRPVPLDEAEALVPARDPSASTIASGKELREKIAQAVLELQISSPREMEVVVLKAFEGQTWTAIRDLLGLSSEMKARTLFAHGLDLLRSRVEKAVGEGGLEEALGR